MARYSHIFSGGMASCNINGRNISVVGDQIYVDGILYVPANESDSSASGMPFTPGKYVKHMFEVSSDFSSIVSKGFVDVVFRQSEKDDDFEVRGWLPENFIDKMIITVESGTLFISIRPGTYNNLTTGKNSPTIFVTNKLLKDVTASGSGDFSVEGDLKATEDGFTLHSSGSGDFRSGKIMATKSHVSVSTSGSGDIEMSGVETIIFLVNISGSADVDCGTVQAQSSSIGIKGSGDVRISGSTDSVEFSIAGSGNISASDLVAKTGKASIAGSGDITCNVERLSDRVRGSGDVHNRY